MIIQNGGRVGTFADLRDMPRKPAWPTSVESPAGLEAFQERRGLNRSQQSFGHLAQVSRFPILGEWHGPADSVMPVWHDVH
jgi:hypothetical protein